MTLDRISTYKQIQEYIKQEHGYTAKTCWIAHMNEVCDLKPEISPNRYSSDSRVHPCPPAKQDAIKEAFRHFKII